MEDKKQPIILEEKIEEITENSIPTNRFRAFLEKLNSKIDKSIKGFRGFLTTPLGRVFIFGIVLLLLTIPILAVVLGFDNYLIRSSIEGTVFHDGKGVENAEFIIQGRSVFTNNKGEFKIDNLDYGRWDIEIKANGYNTLKDKVVLNRFGNKLGFELIPVDFGNSKGQLISSEILIIDQLILKINDQEIKVQKDGTFETGRIIVGKYNLTLTSPFYKDFSQEIEIKNGTQSLSSITIYPSGDLKGNIVDFITGTEIKEFELKSEKQYTVDKQGATFTIKDIQVGEVVKLNIQKTNYITQPVEIMILQGENSLNKIKLIPNGKILSFRNGSLQESNYDGTQNKDLTSGIVGCRIINNSNTYVNARCADKVYSINKNSAEPVRISYLLDERDIYIPNKGTVIVDDSNKETVKFMSDTEEKVLFESETEKIISLLSDVSGENVYISTNEALYKVNIADPNNNQKLTDGIFYIKDITDDGSKLLTINYATSVNDISNIWIINSNGEKTRITQFAQHFGDMEFVDSNNIIYIKSVYSTSGLYKRSVNSQSETQIFSNVDRYLLSGTLVTGSLGSDIYITDINNIKPEKFK